MNKIIVLGSINMDMVLEVDGLPQVGETILGKSIDYFMGGKGANQAVAASRIGGETLLIGKVGNDTFGQKVVEHLKREKINCAAVEMAPNIFTGIASIFKLEKDNAIVVSPGANMLLTDIDNQLNQAIHQKDIFITQLEIPLATVKRGLKQAQEKGAITILNPAPYNKEVLNLLQYVDIVTPNETEFEAMIGESITNNQQLEKTMLAWQTKHKTTLIVTRGAIGTSYIADQQIVTVPAIKVDVSDTTGAGDTFNGTLAALLAENNSLSEAINMASASATLSVTKRGAQTGMPTREEVHQFIKASQESKETRTDSYE